MDRREFIRSSCAAAGSMALGINGSARAASDGPNIILMVADNLGWRDLNCYGDPNAKTPNIDRLASEGVRFTNAFVAAPSCSPSRASIITGQAPHSVNVLGLTHLYPRYQLSPSVPTLPAQLAQNGYNTAIEGKWHVAPYRRVARYGYKNHMAQFKVDSSDNARRFISRNINRPFFLEINFMQTHRPSLPGRSRAYAQHPDFPVDPETIVIPDYWNIPQWPEIMEDVAGYYSRGAWMDFIIGEVMEHLESEKLSDRTLVIFLSDNGPMYPGGIGTCYDFGIGTPLIMRWPEIIPSGKVSEALVSAIDIAPTCMDAAGISAPKTMQGKSLLPNATNDMNDVHEAVFAEMTYHVKYTPMRAIRTGKYKYILNINDTPVGLDMCEEFEWAHRVAQRADQKCCAPRPPEELYELENDPTELNNLATLEQYSTVKEELAERLARWRTQTGDPLIEQ